MPFILRAQGYKLMYSTLREDSKFMREHKKWVVLYNYFAHCIATMSLYSKIVFFSMLTHETYHYYSELRRVETMSDIKVASLYIEVHIYLCAMPSTSVSQSCTLQYCTVLLLHHKGSTVTLKGSKCCSSM